APIVAELLLTQLYPGKKVEDLNESEKQIISALTTMAGSLAGSLAGGDSAGALTGAQAAKNEVENNYLAADQITRLASKVKDCRLHRDEGCIKQAVQAAVKLSDANSNAMRSESCRNDRACLDRHMKKIEQAAGVYQQIVGLAQGGIDTAGLAFGNSATPTLTDTRYYYDQIRLNPELQTPFEKQFYAMSANNRAGFETLIFGKPLNEKERFALLTGAVGNPVQGVLADAAANYAKEAGISPQQLAVVSAAIGALKGVRSVTTFSGSKNNSHANNYSEGGTAESIHPLLSDSIKRAGDRLVVNQGPYPTCGANSCAMVLDTMGKPVVIQSLINRIPPKENGITTSQVRGLLRSEGIDAAAYGRRNIDDLARYTKAGQPVIVRVENASSNFSHFVVVDGVTVKNGVKVVAIRDPQNMQYFSPVSTFEKYFSGEVVVPKKR
ncbi:VENN motif pre-toxin domain-containing protein, partial [Chromobacterium vaccinii]|nr:VENN motif pre-toxin domain-containing protein [Chromobacterium vaccinii]